MTSVKYALIRSLPVMFCYLFLLWRRAQPKWLKTYGHKNHPYVICHVASILIILIIGRVGMSASSPPVTGR